MAKKQLNIQILTLNTALLPKIAGISVGMGNNAIRAGNISRLVLENQKSYDVVCFQEAFDTKIIKEHFVKPLAPVYPHYFIDERPGKMGLGVNSGLCIFSKFPIEAKDYENYQCFTGEETFAEKGLRGVKLRVDGQAVYVVTSHLQAGGGPKIIQFISKLIPNFIVARKCECPNGSKPVSTDEVRIAELYQAKKFMDRFSKNEAGPIFFTGDFNINSKLEAQWLEKALKIFPGVLDTFDPQRAKWNSTTWNPPPTTFPGERNDYIWFINHSTYADGFQGFSQPTILFGEQNSDHLAVEGAFTLSLAVRAKL